MAIDWYEGDVGAAVAQAKTLKASLIVFVTSHDDYSYMYEKILNSLDTSNKWYVAISIDAYTEAHEQLKAIYKIVPVPSVLVIDWETGMVMERIAGPIFGEELQEAFLDEITNRPLGQQSVEPSQKSHNPTQEPEPPKLTHEPDMAISVGSSLQDAVLDVAQPSDTSRQFSETKIQFKLKSEAKMIIFRNDETLSNVRKAVQSLFELRSPFELAVPYPRRSLDRSMDGMTLTQLDLCPASSLLVIPMEDASVFPWSIFQTIGGFLQPILNFLLGLWQQMFGGARPPSHPKASGSGDKKTN